MSHPDHRYDFQDSVYTTVGKGGFVQSIRQGDSARQWLYQLDTTGDHWWSEEELTPACPKCLSPVALKDTHCPACGFLLDN